MYYVPLDSNLNSNLNSGRVFWSSILAIPLFCVALAHFFFQNYLFMPPCEQCVYTRFYMFIIALGAVFALISRRLLPLAYALGAWGVIAGARVCLHLMAIRRAIESANPFGVKPCKMIPEYPFGLPLHEWWEGMFAPTGECGFDAPLPPLDASLDPVQTWFGEFYGEGWYLVPQFKFINLGEASLIVFAFLGLALLWRGFFDLRVAISNLKKENV